MFGFGDAQFFGSTGGMHLNAPDRRDRHDPRRSEVIGSWPREGGVFAFGYVHFFGSMGGWLLNEPIVGMASNPSTGGYWEVASDGGIFAFGAPFVGSTGEPSLGRSHRGDGVSRPAVLGSIGRSDRTAASVALRGDAHLLGSMGGRILNSPVAGMAATPSRCRVPAGGFRRRHLCLRRRRVRRFHGGRSAQLTHHRDR